MVFNNDIFFLKNNILKNIKNKINNVNIFIIVNHVIIIPIFSIIITYNDNNEYTCLLG